MSYLNLNLAAVNAVTKQFNTVFFNAALQPVVPVEGQWFVEMDANLDDIDTPDEELLLRDEALVEYVGDGRVFPEYADSDRAPNGLILILQS